MWRIHRSPVNCPHKGQWCRALMFCLICAWINDWINNREACDLRYHHAHYDITVMRMKYCIFQSKNNTMRTDCILILAHCLLTEWYVYRIHFGYHMFNIFQKQAPHSFPTWMSYEGVSFCMFEVCPMCSLNALMMTSSNGKIFHVTGPLCGEFTGHRWISFTKASDAELWYFVWSAPQ